MKEYRLAAWPELDAPYQRMAYRRMLSDMSQRHVTLARLTATSGLARHEVIEFVALLIERGLVVQRDATPAAEGIKAALGPLRGWLRRTFAPTQL